MKAELTGVIVIETKLPSGSDQLRNRPGARKPLPTFFQHLYPKSQIDVHVVVLEDSGSVLASALTCAGLALADASIHMFDVIIGASLVRLAQFVKVGPGNDGSMLA